jgi:hypothetical protein
VRVPPHHEERVTVNGVSSDCRWLSEYVVVAIARAMAEYGEIGRIWSLRRPRVYYAIGARACAPR